MLCCLQDQLNSVARFLDARGRTADALEVATDPDYKFELAVQLGKLDIALQIAETADSEGKWRQLSELAMSSGKLQASNRSSWSLMWNTCCENTVKFDDTFGPIQATCQVHKLCSSKCLICWLCSMVAIQCAIKPWEASSGSYLVASLLHAV